jgi:hypothetical protein
MPRRGRPSDYTADEDAIILSTPDTKEVQRRLLEAGFPERTPAAIWSRRKHLRDGGDTDLPVAALDAEEEGTMLFARRRRLLQHINTLERKLAEMRTEVEDVNDRLRSLVGEDGASSSGQ